jgi:uncharacterized membrane protein
LAGALSLAGLATAQMGQGGMPMHERRMGATTRPMNAQEMQQHREQMMQRMEKMEQDTKEMNQRLDEKLAAMHSAQGQAKIDAMAAVVDELVQQRKAMVAHRTDMMNRMIEHMRARDERMMGAHHGMKGMDMDEDEPTTRESR